MMDDVKQSLARRCAKTIVPNGWELWIVIPSDWRGVYYGQASKIVVDRKEGWITFAHTVNGPVYFKSSRAGVAALGAAILARFRSWTKRDSDTRPKDGDALAAPLASSAAIAQTPVDTTNKQGE